MQLKISPWQFVLHALFWVVYTLLSGVLTGISDQNYTLGIKSELVMLPVKMALTYFVLWVSVPMYMEDKTRAKSIFLTLLALLMAMVFYRLILMGFIFPQFYPERQRVFWSSRGFLLVAFDLFTGVAAATTVKLTRMFYRSKRHQDALEKERVKSELNYLRTQTNPHYLFNTLNTLYGLALRKDEHTPEAILRLSQIMNFTLHQSLKHAVPLEEEVNVLRSIIDLEKLRSTQVPDIQFVENIDNPDCQIAPMLLVPFVENAFKHGVASAPDKPFVHIRIEEDADQLVFEVLNNYKETPQNDKESLGLANVKRQLELLYAGQYSLSIEKHPDVHQVRLNLNLNALSREFH